MNRAVLDIEAPAAATDLLAQTADEVLLRAQNRALEMVVRGAPLTSVLSFLTEIVEQQAEGRVIAAILLLDADGCLRTGAAPSLPDDYNQEIDGLKAREDLGTCSVAAVTGEVVVTPEFDSDPKWQSIKHLPLGLGLKSAWSQPVIGGDGRVLGTFGTYFRECRQPTALERQLVAVLSHTAALAIERKRAEDLKEQQRQILDTALEAAGMGTWHYTLSDNMCHCSPRAQKLYGLASPDWLHDEAGVRDVLHPDDIPAMWDRVRQACDPLGNGRYSAEYRVRSCDRGWRWLSVWGVVEFEGEGAERRAVSITGAGRDVSEQKEAEHQQKILVEELNHRVKNTLAVIQSIAKQTLRNTPDPAAFNETFSARLAALSRTHSLITNTYWQKVALREIVSQTFDPFVGDRQDERIVVDGPALLLKASTAVTLSLVLHELSTNAAKHGALSVPGGSVSLRWRSRKTDPDAPLMVELDWAERDGLMVTVPSRQGLGSKLISASAEQLGGEASLHYEPQGFRCRFTFLMNE